jgi:chemotaxis protein methyltransferase WspC
VNPMKLVEFEDLLKRTIGLDTASVGSSVVGRAVQARMSACELEDRQAYWDHVQASRTELQELVEAVVIPETWFFRDREAFAAMARMANEEWLANHAQGVLRILSLPCSTGEEPYSMAMALLDSGFPADRFSIDAIDVSARARARAERGVYGKNSFRGSELGFLDRHFARTTQGYQLSESVRRHVQFKHGNLFASPVPQCGEIYDVIFCRNLLIYFDTAAQERAIGLLTHLLALPKPACCSRATFALQKFPWHLPFAK